MACIGQVKALEVSAGVVGVVQLPKSRALQDMLLLKLGHFTLQDVLHACMEVNAGVSAAFATSGRRITHTPLQIWGVTGTLLLGLKGVL